LGDSPADFDALETGQFREVGLVDAHSTQIITAQGQDGNSYGEKEKHCVTFGKRVKPRHFIGLIEELFSGWGLQFCMVEGVQGISDRRQG
jgi:hypothetical protein